METRATSSQHRPLLLANKGGSGRDDRPLELLHAYGRAVARHDAGQRIRGTGPRSRLDPPRASGDKMARALANELFDLPAPKP